MPEGSLLVFASEVKVAPHLARTVYPWHWLHLIEKMFKTPQASKRCKEASFGKQ
jgi:hypothetical protein